MDPELASHTNSIRSDPSFPATRTLNPTGLQVEGQHAGFEVRVAVHLLSVVHGTPARGKVAVHGGWGHGNSTTTAEVLLPTDPAHWQRGVRPLARETLTHWGSYSVMFFKKTPNTHTRARACARTHLLLFAHAPSIDTTRMHQIFTRNPHAHNPGSHSQKSRPRYEYCSHKNRIV